jgi:hypothetical protein
VQVSSSEGVANHTVPESCAGAREGFGEALTGVRIGWVLSRENRTPGTPTLCFEWKATCASVLRKTIFSHRGTDGSQTRCRREPDSNHRSRITRPSVNRCIHLISHRRKSRPVLVPRHEPHGFLIILDSAIGTKPRRGTRILSSASSTDEYFRGLSGG